MSFIILGFLVSMLVATLPPESAASFDPTRKNGRDCANRLQLHYAIMFPGANLSRITLEDLMDSYANELTEGMEISTIWADEPANADSLNAVVTTYLRRLSAVNNVMFLAVADEFSAPDTVSVVFPIPEWVPRADLVNTAYEAHADNYRRLIQELSLLDLRYEDKDDDEAANEFQLILLETARREHHYSDLYSEFTGRDRAQLYVSHRKINLFNLLKGLPGKAPSVMQGRRIISGLSRIEIEILNRIESAR